MTKYLSPAAFETLITEVLENLFDQLMDQCDDLCKDLSLDTGVLTVSISDRQVFVVSKHKPTQQLWLSSPVSGAWHFRPLPIEESALQWTSTKDSSVFFPQLLEQELSAIFNQIIELDVHVS